MLRIKAWVLSMIFFLGLLTLITFRLNLIQINLQLSFFLVFATLVCYWVWIWRLGRTFRHNRQTGFVSQQTFKFFYPISILSLPVIPLISDAFELSSTGSLAILGIAFSTFMFCVFIVSLAFHQKAHKRIHLIKIFVSILILPIGIWVIKPQLNKLLSEK